MIRINLLPPEYREAQRQKRMSFLGGVAAGFVVLLLLGFIGVRRIYATRLDKKAMGYREELSQLQAVVDQIKQMEAAKNEIQTKRNVIRSLGERRLVYPFFFEDFLDRLPAGVWLTSLQTSGQGTSLSLSIQANAGSNFAIANWMSNLETSDRFKSPQLGGITYGDTGQGGTATFPVQCTYERPPAAEGKD